MHPNHPPRARLPIGLLLIVTLIALLLIGGSATWLAWQWYILDQTLPTIASALRVALFASPLIAGGVGLAIAWRRWASAELLKADRVVALTAAQQQRFPAGLHSLSFHDSSKPQVAPTPEPLALPEPDPPGGIPTFAQLLDAGTIGAGQPLLFGFDALTGQPITGNWMDLYSVGGGGLPGSGKTTAAAVWVAQSALSGARIILADPHSGNPESLASRLAPLSAAFVCDPAQTTKEIVAALQLCHDKLRRRAAGQSGHWPLLFICDEWTSLLRTSAAAGLPELVKNISQEGRKYGIFAILLAQNWGQDQSGHVRDELCSHLVMRTRPELGRHQTGLRASQLPDDLLQLAPGVGYLLNNKGDVRKLRIPRLEDSDLTRVGAMLATTVHQPSQPIGFRAPKTITPTAHRGAGSEPDRSRIGAGSGASGSRRAVPAEAARVLDLLHAGNDLPAIVQELRGVSSKQSGSRYQAALKEITDLLRQATKGN
jgi:hypothetical protein